MRVQNNARGGGSKNGLANTMKLLIAVVFTITIALLNITEPAPQHKATLTVTETASAIAPPEPTPATTAPAAAEPAVVVQTEQVPQPAPAAPAAATCQSEIAKYDWAQSTALAVSFAESGHNPGSVGDLAIQYYQDGIQYGASYGCFQIRYLPGRPAPASLLDATYNVKYAHDMFTNQGWQPWSAYTTGKYLKYL